jgi:hypothetical protein
MPEIGDVINLLSDNPASNDVELLKLATIAARAADESRAASAKAKALKADLEDAMNEKKVTALQLQDRKITFTTKNSKQKTMKAMKQILGDAAGKKLWDNLPTVPSTSLDIPKPQVDEPSQ